MKREILKRVWDHLTPGLRLLFCRCLCFFGASKRHNAPPPQEPHFICGPFVSNSGIGQGARLYADSVQNNAGKPYLVDLTAAMHMPPDMQFEGSFINPDEYQHMTGTVVIHANPPQFQLAIAHLGRKFLENKRVVAYWAWEIESFPPIWHQALDYVDEIEVPSKFVADALARITDRVVTVKPHSWPNPSKYKREFAIGGIVRCLYVFDAASSFMRKNPLAAVAAFKEAFQHGEAVLRLKVSHADQKTRQILESECAGSEIEIIYEEMDRERMEELFLAHDIYISLHRSEGFGLTILEALKYGLYVVATGWSGNMDFMTGPRAFRVPFTLNAITFDRGPCKGLTTLWAEADVHEAARILTHIRQEIAGHQSGSLC